MYKRKVKWVDDMSCMAALHLPSSLVVDSRPDIPRPLPYRGRHGLRLPRESNALQDELDSLNLYASNRKLDGVGPVDNRPSTDKLQHFKKKNNVTCDT